jgi:hypothetical protein
VIGQATTAGSDGLGAGAQLLTVDKIANQTSTPIALSAANGSSFHLIAGGGGILLDRPLTTFQPTVISSTGDVTINQPLATSNNNLTMNAANLILGPSGSISVGTGACALNGGACPGVGGSGGAGGSGGGAGGGLSDLPPEVEPLSIPPENVLVSSTDQAVTPPAAISSGTEDTEEEKSDTAKKPVCTGGGTSQGATGVAAGVSSGGRRCTSRGCS